MYNSDTKNSLSTVFKRLESCLSVPIEIYCVKKFLCWYHFFENLVSGCNRFFDITFSGFFLSITCSFLKQYSQLVFEYIGIIESFPKSYHMTYWMFPCLNGKTKWLAFNFSWYFQKSEVFPNNVNMILKKAVVVHF
jgi:hypothetical protein